MLELACLAIGPWIAPRPGKRRHWYRVLRDAQSGDEAGVAVWQAGSVMRWLRFLWPAQLAVHESDDEPLLFTAQKLWTPWPRWTVLDADLRTIGTIRSPWLFDSQRRRVAKMDWRATRRDLRFLAEAGQELAVLSGEEERFLRFHDNVLDEPFLKMLVLAGALLV
jgi:hypothetical protein